MGDDLKERLRNWDCLASNDCGDAIRDEAADRIATLEAQLEVANEDLTVAYMQGAADAREKAQADRDAAVAAVLEEAASKLHALSDDALYDDGPEGMAAAYLEASSEVRALIPQTGAEALERARAVRVKPLVWEDNGDGSFYAETPFGEYTVESGELYPAGSGRKYSHGNADAAKAAGQQHFKSAVLSAIEPVTPDMLAQASADGMREAASLVGSMGTEYHPVSNAILAAIEKGEG